MDGIISLHNKICYTRLVLKIASPDIGHKSDDGAVAVEARVILEEISSEP